MRLARLLLLFLGATTALGGLARRSSSSAPVRGGRDPVAERRIRDADIGFFDARVRRDTSGALDPLRLGALLLERGRANGAESDLIAAEQHARRSLANREARNGVAWQLLAAVLVARHRFPEARKAAARAAALEPDRPGARALLGEVLLELGEYEEAARVFAGLRTRRHELSVAPRYARWLELQGKSREAIALLAVSARGAAQDDGLSAQQIGWFSLRLAELELRMGRTPHAARWLDRAAPLLPEDPRYLSARAHLALARHDAAQAIAFGDSALAIRPDPEAFALLAAAWEARGDRVRAEEYVRALEGMSAASTTGIHRSVALALLDHNRRVPEVLKAAQRELEEHQDVYSWDVLAWALWKSGRPGDAWRAMVQALRQRTDDPRILAHARVIAESL